MYVSLSSQKVMVVGVEPSGNRSILMPTERAVNPEAFARTFIGNYTNYSPNTVTQNIREALLLSSPGFVKAHEIKFGSRLEEQIKDENVVQVTLINRVEVEDLKESGFNARVYATKYRTMLNETKENYVVYEMTVSAGPITKRNPWGYYVQTINERETISR